MSTTYKFAFDAPAKAALPQLESATPSLGEDLPTPSTGDTVVFHAIASHAFVVTHRTFEYDGSGGVVISLGLTLASERSV